MGSFFKYVKDSKNELLNKVSWPSYKEVLFDAVFLLIACVILSLIVFIIDKFLGEILLSSFYSLLN